MLDHGERNMEMLINPRWRKENKNKRITKKDFKTFEREEVKYSETLPPRMPRRMQSRTAACRAGALVRSHAVSHAMRQCFFDAAGQRARWSCTARQLSVEQVLSI